MYAHGAPPGLAATLQSARPRARGHRVLQASGRSRAANGRGRRPPSTAPKPNGNVRPTATSQRMGYPAACMYFDQFKHQLPDIDPDETDEWMASLDQVVAEEGEVRGRFLVYKLLKRARQLQIGLPPLTQTRYINTISPEQEPDFPGDEEMELRIRRIIRWNAMAMVLRANSRFSGIGGHLSTYASLGEPVRDRLQPLLPREGRRRARRPDLLPGPRRAGHLRPGVPRGPPDRGPARPLPPRDRPGPGPVSSYPHPRLMPDFWEFPTVSMGLGPISAIYQARFNRYLHNRGLADTSRVARVGVPRRRRDRRARVARRAPRRRPRGPRQPDLRRQLQPAAPRRPGARQRQDHPGARGGLPRLGLERHQGHLGARVGRAARPRRRRRAGPADERRPSTASSRSSRSRAAPTSASTSSGRTRGSASSSSTSPTTTSPSSAAAATTTARSTRRTRRPPSTRAPRRSSSPRPSRAGRSGAGVEARNVTHQTKKLSEAELRDLPRPPAAADPRRPA